MKVHIITATVALALIPGVVRAQLQEMRQTIFGMD